MNSSEKQKPEANSRPLDEPTLIENFLSKAIGCPELCDDHQLINDIALNEKQLPDWVKLSTLKSPVWRDSSYRSEKDRWSLRNQIVQELFKKKRLNDDNQIKLGKGGAHPSGTIKNDRQAFIIIGLPASGKSTVANPLADHFGAIIIDSDFAKRKLPEFENIKLGGASIVHKESKEITFTGFAKAEFKRPRDFSSLFELCKKDGTNVIIPVIGHSQESILNYAKPLKEIHGYSDVHLILVNLDRKRATERAVKRFQKSGRYVSLSLIFDGYANDPILTFYRLRYSPLYKESKLLFSSFIKIESGLPPQIIDSEGDDDFINNFKSAINP